MLSLATFRAASSSRRSRVFSQLVTVTKQSYILQAPGIYFDEVCTDQRHWPLGGGAYISLIKGGTIDCHFHHNEGEGIESICHEVCEAENFIHKAKSLLDEEGSNCVYDYEDINGIPIQMSKKGVYTNDENPEIQLLSPAGMKNLVSFEGEMGETEKEWEGELRQEALEWLRDSHSPLGAAISDYEENGSYYAWEAIEDGWAFESEQDSLIEKYGFTDEELLSKYKK